MLCAYASGRLVVENGILTVCNAYTGNNFCIQFYHLSYLLNFVADRLFGLKVATTEENFLEFNSFLKDNLVDLIDVKVSML